MVVFMEKKPFTLMLPKKYCYFGNRGAKYQDSGRKVTVPEERKIMPLIVATTFFLQRILAHALRWTNLFESV